jgi:3-dehydroquinate dehydratase / shikimate dehydrogenase
MVDWALHIVHRMVEARIPRGVAEQGIIQKSLEIRMLGRDKLCAVVAAQDAGSMHRQLTKALRQTRTAELRLDWLSDNRERGVFLRRLAAKQPRATLIATCRRRGAGGRFRGTIANQLAHLAEAIGAGAAWYDLEIETVRKVPQRLLDELLGHGRRLTSAHFFQGLPRNLSAVATELGNGQSDAIKVAAQCNSLAQSRRLLSFARKRRNTVAVPMGDVALPARFLALREKQAFAYAPVENSTAPGQISLDEMKQLYRADRFDRRTHVYGVIGNPISHSLSPAMQNAAFARRQMNAVYLPFPTRDLRDFIDSVKPLDVKGFSVTLPHKERVLRFLDGCDLLVEKIGAVNTVAVRDDGKLYGYNTDYVGVLQTLERRLKLRDSRVLVLGAGGAARAVAFALSQAGSAVCVCARRPQRAKLLARAAGGEALPKAQLRHESFDAIVNATPVGMHPSVGSSPLEARELNCSLVFDTIYRPRTTRLLQMAVRRGIETVSGVEMFVAQGAAQWEIWTGDRAPVAAMRRAVLRALSGEDRGKTISRRGPRVDG